jgi:hypothetical protein
VILVLDEGKAWDEAASGAYDGDRRLKRTQALRHIGREGGDGVIQEVDVLNHLATDEGMVSAEAAAEGLLELGNLGSQA